jgi:hypothetical protein
MKKYIIGLFSLLFLMSCEEYLDKAPDAGLQEEDIFERQTNFRSYFDAAYEGQEKDGSNNRQVNIKCGYPLYISFWDQKVTFDELTEIADAGRRFRVQDWKAGQMGATVNMMTTDLVRRPILKSMFRVIRISNMTIANLHRIKDMDEKTINDFMGQAYFLRGYAHFALIRLWGPMPHVNKLIGENPNDWDMVRPTANQSYRNVAMDMDSAFKYFEKGGAMRRDNVNEFFRPNGVAAIAMKARALLYAASPLNNVNGVEDWKAAAVANWEAIQLAKQYSFDLLEMKDYSLNYLAQYSNEQLFAWTAGNTRTNTSGDLQGLLSGAIGNRTSGNSGECPTQNMIDKFEVVYQGKAYALNTEQDRAAAAAAGAYNEQNPYINRDPRFYNSIIYNQAPIVWSTYQNKAQIWYQVVNGATVYGEHRNEIKYQGTTRTGYYCKKHTGDISGGYTSYKPYLTDPIIRLGELYLNYAEAANEAYGPTGAAPGAALTAEGALNVIRSRATLPNVDAAYLASKEVFRDKIKNERTVELCFEGHHHYYDIRRWKDAPALLSQLLYGVHAEKLSGTSAQYPTGFRYIRYELPADRQPRWKDPMYFIPFDTDDYYKMKNFDTSLNPAW